MGLVLIQPFYLPVKWDLTIRHKRNFAEDVADEKMPTVFGVLPLGCPFPFPFPFGLVLYG